MKHFTPQLFVELQECEDAAAFRLVNEKWERAVHDYGASLQQLTPRMDPGLRRFVGHGSLHDVAVVDLGITRRRLTAVLKEENPARLLTITYRFIEVPAIDLAALPAEHRSPRVTWLYDELDVDPTMLYNPRLHIQQDASTLSGKAIAEEGWRPIWSHDILLSNGWEVRVRFHRIFATRATSLFGGGAVTDGPSRIAGKSHVPSLSAKQLRILKVLQGAGGWLTRAQMEEQAGRKGFSLALGAPTRGEPRPGSLEHLGYVERKGMSPPFEYRITDLGERALSDYEREQGTVPLLSALPRSPEVDQ